MKYGWLGQRPVRGHRPAFDRSLPVVGDAQPEVRRGSVTVGAREVGSGSEAGDLGCDRRGRIAALLLPALDPEGGAVRDDEVRRRLDVVLVERRVGQPQLVGHQDRVRGLVELRAERVGRRLAVDQAVARHRAVGLLLAVEQEQRRVPRGLYVSVGHQAGPRLVQVAGEHLAVGAEVGVVRVARRHRLPPRRRQARHDRAGEGLVLRGLDHVRAQVVLVPKRTHRLALDPIEVFRRLGERLVVVLPTLPVLSRRLVEGHAERALGLRDRVCLRAAETEREHRRPIAAELHLPGLHDVAVRRVAVVRAKHVRGV